MRTVTATFWLVVILVLLHGAELALLLSILSSIARD